MAAMDHFLRNAAIAALLGGTVALSGCGAGGVDLQVDAPVLNAVGINLSSKKKDDEDLPERAGLVVPPSTDTLPPPGTQTAAAAPQNWPDDQDKRKKHDAEEKPRPRRNTARRAVGTTRPISQNSIKTSAWKRAARPSLARPSANPLAEATAPTPLRTKLHHGCFSARDEGHRAPFCFVRHSLRLPLSKL